MLHRELVRGLCILLVLCVCLPMIGTAQNAVFSFTTGTSEDEAAIRKTISADDFSAQTAANLDWENAVGGRYNDLQKLKAFVGTGLKRIQGSAAYTRLETKIRFIDPSVAVADEYWCLVGQIDPGTGKPIHDRWGRTTYVLKKSNGIWTLVLERIADLVSPWYQHFTSLPSPAPIAAATLARYTGTYEAKSGLAYEISVAGDRLTVKAPGVVGVAIPQSESEFYYFRDQSDPGNHRFIKFSTSPDGIMTATIAGPENDRPLSLKKMR